jgi:RNA-directed DNA polymerase
MTDRRLLLLPVDVIVANVNQFVRGWGAYFRYGNSARHFDKIRACMRMRMVLVIAKRHKRSRGFCWHVVAFASRGWSPRRRRRASYGAGELMRELTTRCRR